MQCEKKINKKCQELTDDDFYQISQGIQTGGVESFVYIKNNLVYKFPVDINHVSNITNSYIAGTKLNNLKVFVPNFPQTKELFCYKKIEFVSQDYIKGDMFDDLIKKDKLNFDQFINIYVQILFALEIAQRQYRFCHYDLHTKNYTLVISDTRVDITAENYIPMIIDYGLSSIQFNNEIIGTTHYRHAGIEKYLTPCFDMYKLLYYCYLTTKGNLQRQIGELFLFFGDKDPYKILLADSEKISDIDKTFLKDVTYSEIAACTPLEMISWIINRRYNLKIKISARNLFLPNLKIDNFNIEKINCPIAGKYLEKITEYKFRGGDCRDEIDQKYKLLQIPDMIRMAETAEILFTVQSVEKYYAEKNKLDYIDIALEFVKKIEPYCNILYTIRELGMENNYSNFINNFTQSEQYKFYQESKFLIDKASRWLETIYNF
jgi:hypothetical protein